MGKLSITFFITTSVLFSNLAFSAPFDGDIILELEDPSKAVIEEWKVFFGGEGTQTILSPHLVAENNVLPDMLPFDTSAATKASWAIGLSKELDGSFVLKSQMPDERTVLGLLSTPQPGSRVPLYHAQQDTVILGMKPFRALLFKKRSKKPLETLLYAYMNDGTRMEFYGKSFSSGFNLCIDRQIFLFVF